MRPDGVDAATLRAYDREAAHFAQDWETQPTPTDMQALLLRSFQPGPTADVGCGSGRDAAWLAAQGFDVVGYDASSGLLAEARRLHPGVRFTAASLPELSGIADCQFVNVMCETVIMHLPPAAIAASVRRLLAILAPGGVLYLSWRVTLVANRRDDHGRLYAAFDPAVVFAALGSAELLLDEERDSASSGKLVRRIIVRKKRDHGPAQQSVP